jgi:hypothetical protein
MSRAGGQSAPAVRIKTLIFPNGTVATAGHDAISGPALTVETLGLVG